MIRVGDKFRFLSKEGMYIASMYILTVVFLLLIADVARAEPFQLSSVKPEEIAVLQYDSRPLQGYWLTSAQWNNFYCKKHGHVFIYYTMTDKCRYYSSRGSTELAAPWCKVRAMIQANYDYPNVKVFIYMDSDAVMNKKFENQPINHMLGVMQDRLKWNVDDKPIVFNQDGACWWCNLVAKVGYDFCLNAGTVLWYRHEKSDMILKEWWDASMDSYENNPIRRKFRMKWPWEQDRQMAVYNRSRAHIQIASEPDRPFMRMLKGDEDWCLSHLPRSSCFVSHFCEGQWSKKKMMELYQTHIADRKQISNSSAVSEHAHDADHDHKFTFRIETLRIKPLDHT